MNSFVFVKRGKSASSLATNRETFWDILLKSVLARQIERRDSGRLAEKTGGNSVVSWRSKINNQDRTRRKRVDGSLGGWRMVLEGRNGSRVRCRKNEVERPKRNEGGEGKNERKKDEWKKDEKFRADWVRVPFELDYVTKISRIELETKGGVDSGWCAIRKIEFRRN